MTFIRSATLRASSLTRAARPIMRLRTAELQPWQRAVQRRTYASGHGGHGETKSSDVPWAAGAAIGTAAGLYLVLNQDLGHGESHDDHHDDSHGKAHEEEAESESKDDSKDEGKDDKEDKEDKEDNKKDEGKTSPDKSDKPNPRGEAKKDETSGKQEGISNADTKHSTDVAHDDTKSTKGEGVAETAKLKGTVSTDRPGAENKEERGKAQEDKDA